MTIISLGSNISGADAIIDSARRRIGEVACIEASSGTYRAPDDTGRGDDYTNEVLCIDTPLSREDFERLTRSLETEAGRTPDSRSRGVMPLDIDVVVWRGTTVKPYDLSRPYFRTGYRLLQELQHH